MKSFGLSVESVKSSHFFNLAIRGLDLHATAAELVILAADDVDWPIFLFNSFFEFGIVPSISALFAAELYHEPERVFRDRLLARFVLNWDVISRSLSAFGFLRDGFFSTH